MKSPAHSAARRKPCRLSLNFSSPALAGLGLVENIRIKMPKPKPLPQTISALCGYCSKNDAKIILPDQTLACKECASKMGIEILWRISNDRLRKIYAAVQKKAGKKIPLWKFAALLGIETSSRMSAANYVSAFLSDRAIVPAVAEEALKLEQLEGKDVLFLLEQIEMSQ